MGYPVIQVPFLQMATAGWMLNVFSILPSISLLTVGICIRVIIENKINVIEDYNTRALQHALIAMGVLSIAVNITGTKLCHDCTRSKTKKRARHFLFGYVIFHLIISLGVLASAIMCFVDLVQMNNFIGERLSFALNQYKSDQTIKEEIDSLQIYFACCGNIDYKDWFQVSWAQPYFFPTYYLDEKRGLENHHPEGGIIIDSVPYSCCDPESFRPCVHRHVQKNSHHFNYDYRVNTTLYKTGCRDALIGSFGQMLTISGCVILGIFLIQLIVLLVVRLLQTSLDYAHKHGNMAADTYIGWIVGNQPKNDVSVDNKDENPIETVNEKLLKNEHGSAFKHMFGNAHEKFGHEHMYNNVGEQPFGDLNEHAFKNAIKSPFGSLIENPFRNLDEHQSYDYTEQNTAELETLHHQGLSNSPHSQDFLDDWKIASGLNEDWNTAFPETLNRESEWNIQTPGELHHQGVIDNWSMASTSHQNLPDRRNTTLETLNHPSLTDEINMAPKGAAHHQSFSDDQKSESPENPRFIDGWKTSSPGASRQLSFANDWNTVSLEMSNSEGVNDEDLNDEDLTNNWNPELLGTSRHPSFTANWNMTSTEIPHHQNIADDWLMASSEPPRKQSLTNDLNLASKGTPHTLGRTNDLNIVLPVIPSEQALADDWNSAPSGTFHYQSYSNNQNKVSAQISHNQGHTDDWNTTSPRKPHLPYIYENKHVSKETPINKIRDESILEFDADDFRKDNSRYEQPRHSREFFTDNEQTNGKVAKQSYNYEDQKSASPRTSYHHDITVEQNASSPTISSQHQAIYENRHIHEKNPVIINRYDQIPGYNASREGNTRYEQSRYREFSKSESSYSSERAYDTSSGSDGQRHRRFPNISESSYSSEHNYDTQQRHRDERKRFSRSHYNTDFYNRFPRTRYDKHHHRTRDISSRKRDNKRRRRHRASSSRASYDRHRPRHRRKSRRTQYNRNRRSNDRDKLRRKRRRTIEMLSRHNLL